MTLIITIPIGATCVNSKASHSRLLTSLIKKKIQIGATGVNSKAIHSLLLKTLIIKIPTGATGVNSKASLFQIGCYRWS